MKIISDADTRLCSFFFQLFAKKLVQCPTFPLGLSMIAICAETWDLKEIISPFTFYFSVFYFCNDCSHIVTVAGLEDLNVKICFFAVSRFCIILEAEGMCWCN